MRLEMAVSYPPAGGNPLPGRRSAASGPSSRHLRKAGSVTTYTLHFTPKGLFISCRVWWPEMDLAFLISKNPAREALFTLP